MTLAAMRLAYPERFHPTQDWFADEPFMHVEPEDRDWPRGVVDALDATAGLVSAVTLAALYLTRPTDPLWSRYLWTADHDRYGQRVYVGDNGRGFEIHRHLHLSPRWGHPIWT